MSQRNWKRYLFRLALAAAAVWAVAWYSDHPLQVVLVALAVYAGWHAINAIVLHNWLQNPERRVPRTAGIWSDIFGRFRDQEEKKEQQKDQLQVVINDFQNMTDAFPDATLVLDQANRVTWFNRAAEQLLNLESEQHANRPVTSLVRSPDFADWLESSEDEVTRMEVEIAPNNRRWLDISSVPIRQNQRLVLLRDVSDAHNLDRMRRDFVTNVSHELRTPLTVMLGYLEIFKDSPPADISGAMDRMHAQAVQMQVMLDDFLELSRLQNSDIDEEGQLVDVPGVLMQLREQAIEISRGDHQLDFEVDRSLKLAGLSADLESAFRNLVVNALKYTPSGGTVTVTWQDTPDGPALMVADTGIGIPREEIPRLTERFYRVGSDRGRETGGSGLGLAIVKHVLNAHQAKLEIDSEPGVGSQFTCIFPPERKVV